MTYNEAIKTACTCENMDDVNALLAKIELDEKISDRQYYNIKHIAIETASEKRGLLRLDEPTNKSFANCVYLRRVRLEF